MEKYLVILIIVILFYLYKYCIQIDNFGDTPVLDAALVNSIKTLGVIATDLQTDGLKVMGEIVLQNKHVLKSVGTTGAAGNATSAMLELREKPSNNLASMKVDGLEVTGTCNLIPIGMILAWNYTDADKNAAGVVTPPSGWAICDGTKVGGITTPDLRNRFIFGEDPTVTTVNSARTGGEETVTLTTNQIPSHTHSYEISNLPWNPGNAGGSSDKVNIYQGTGATVTGYTGGGEPHNNMPPYYVLVYIMKL